nr:DUF4105 domain-containing protein [Segatella copri]
MKIISYFCIVKRFKHIFRVILAVILTNLTTIVTAQDFSGYNAPDISVQNSRVNEEATAWLDSVDISLLTCGPGEEVWSYYGHSALRIQDKAHGSDVAVNWGMFSFRQSFFVLRFVFGLTDYQIGIYPMADFMAEYSAEGRWVRQQRLHLSREEKLKVLHAIEENAQPENRTYRYNFFFDNCTTRAREMVITNIGYCNTNFKDTDAQSTYREEIHKLNGNHRWARFGNDLLLGYLSDRDITQREWEFLPDNLSKDFATEGRKDFINDTAGNAEVNHLIRKDGYLMLVDSTCYLIPPTQKVAEAEAITPALVFITLAVIIIALSVFEWKRKKNFWALDAFLLILTGLPGLILFAMLFSQHPTVQVNFQMLILNPFNLIFVWKTIQKMRQGKLYWYYEVWGICLVVSLFMQIWQTYAEGMVTLALSLLVRYAFKSTMLDLSANNLKIQHRIITKFRKKKKNQK